MVNLREVEITGKPGNIVAIYNQSPHYAMLPTRGIAWGPLNAEGVYRAIIDADRYPTVQIHEYDPDAAEQIERLWHFNTE